MRFVVLALHIALACTASFPMYGHMRGWPPDPPPSPLAELLWVSRFGHYWSVLAAGLPAILSLINLFG